MDLLIGGVQENFGIPGYESWGGPECLAEVPMDLHMYESGCWALILIGAFVFLDIPKVHSAMLQTVTDAGQNQQEDSNNTPVRSTRSSARIKKASVQSDDPLPVTKKTKTSQIVKVDAQPLSLLRKILAFVHLVVAIHLIICKAKTRVLAYILQPCHLLLIFEGLALISTPKFSSAVAIYAIAPLVGATLAICFPDTSGLNFFLEAEAYWVQHILITTVTPITLLYANIAGNNNKAPFRIYRLINTRNLLVGVWVVAVHHWIVLESIDLMTMVNLDFMLCSTAAMKGGFALAPSAILWPSYRTTMCFVVSIFAFPLAYFYRFLCQIVERVFALVSATLKKKV